MLTQHTNILQISPRKTILTRVKNLDLTSLTLTVKDSTATAREDKVDTLVAPVGSMVGIPIGIRYIYISQDM